jgi:hypothetical protein
MTDPSVASQDVRSGIDDHVPAAGQSPSDVNAPRVLTGRCLCGAVTYAVADAFHYAMYCHCSNCRRATGSAFKPFAGVPREKLSIVQGEQYVRTYGEGENFDVHCRECGSLLYSVVREGTYVHVTMGTLVDAPSIRPSKHMFVGSKANWHDITDDLPQYEAFPTDGS